MRRGELFEEFHMNSPGAYHHARFMGRCLYVLKIFLLLNLFPLSFQKKTSLKKIADFIILFYVKYFLSSRLSTAAPRLDLSFIYDMKCYSKLLSPTYQRKITDQAINSAKRHLWYLRPEQVILALFDPGTSEQEKEALAAALRSFLRPDVFEKGKPDFRPVLDKLTDDKPSLSVFVTERSWLVFHLLEVSPAELVWLEFPASTWEHYESYRSLRDYLQDMEVVNDAAERAVKDVGEFARMTRNEGDRDDIILVGSDHRGLVPKINKDNMVHL